MSTSTNRSEAQWTSWLVSRLANALSVPTSRIDVDLQLSQLGLDSLAATRLVAELSEASGLALPATIAWQYPTVAKLANALATGRIQPASRAEASARNDVAEPIAIVGIACRLPRAANPTEYWRLLRDGVDAVGEVPASRGWDAWLRSRNVGSAERAMVMRGAFLDEVEAFDASFFRVSPREALVMDPQQRLMLELCWEALEDAGIPVSSLAGSRTGVYVGVLGHEFALIGHDGPVQSIGPYSATGSSCSIVANRISYMFDVRGPSVAIDTACSSSLVSVQLACEALRRGAASLALAGGVQLNLLAETALSVARFGALSPDGRCHTFDARANGYVRGEGGAVLVLAPLSVALSRGDRVYAIIRGGAVNNDGASNGLTAPNPVAQAELLRAACRDARVDPCEVGYVEAHGTGTQLGDPIEAQALGEVHGAGRPSDAPMLVGSAKTNLGHLEGAAGIAGLLKTALALRHGFLPPNLHFATPNPHARLAERGLAVVTQLRRFPEIGGRRLAGVSSFGFGGTGAHLVLEAPAPGIPLVRRIAAKNSEALRELVSKRLADMPELDRAPMSAELAPTSRSLALGEARIAVVARTFEDDRTALEAFLSGARHPALHRASGVDASAGLVFVSAAGGAQWPGMGRRLFESEPAFRETMLACDRQVRALRGWSPVELILGSSSDRRIQLAAFGGITSMFVSMATGGLLETRGIRPVAVVGHSGGELPAAFLAGALSLDDAVRVACAWSRALEKNSGLGAMALLRAGWERAEELLRRWEGRVFRAIEDSRDGVVIAGDDQSLATAVAALRAEGHECHDVVSDVAPHTPLFDDVRAMMRGDLEGISPQTPRVPIASQIGRLLGAAAELGPEHWVRILSEPCRFAEAIDQLVARGHRLFVEMGTRPVGRYSIESSLRRHRVQGRVLATMSPGADDVVGLAEAEAAIFTEGVVASPSPHATRPLLVCLSARTEAALTALAATYAQLFSVSHDEHARAVCHSLLATRDAHEHRLALVGDGAATVSSALRAFVNGEPAEVSRGRRPTSGTPRIVFVCPGQGAQWAGMCRGLLEHEPSFAAAMTACDEALRTESGFSVIDELRTPEPRLDRIDVVQPLLFAVSVSLAAWWRAMGVEPDAVVGHSMGEVAAAHLAGVLSLRDAARIIARRSALMRRLSGQGSMGLVELTYEETMHELAGVEDRLSVAVSNAPRSTVVSGDGAALDALLARLEKRDVFCKRIKVDVASHSPQMDALRDDLLAALHEIRPEKARVAMRSTVTDAPVRGEELDAEYWVANLRRPVLFGAATRALAAEGPTLFIELSPHPVLVPAIEENLAAVGAEGAALASLRRNEDERTNLFRALGATWARGRAIAADALYDRPRRRPRLPSYPFERERFAIPVRTTTQDDGSESDPLLGREVLSSTRPGERVWERSISVASLPTLDDHRVEEQVVFPAAGYLELALSAGARALGTRALRLSGARFERMLALPPEGARLAQVSWTPSDSGAKVQVATRAPGEESWSMHAAVEVSRGAPLEDASRAFGEAEHACREAIDLAAQHRALVERGLHYGPAFQGLVELRRGDDVALGRVQLPARAREEGDDRIAHFALVDACLQAAFALLDDGPRGAIVPLGVDELRIDGSLPSDVRVLVRRRPELLSFDFVLADHHGRTCAELSGVRLGQLEGSRSSFDEVAWSTTWRPSAHAAARHGVTGPWTIIGEGASVDALARALETRGARVVRRRRGEATGELHGGSVVFCGAIDSPTRLDADTTDAELLAGPKELIALLQEVLRAKLRDTPRVFVVTRGAQPVEGSRTIAPEGAALWGMARTVTLEEPDLELTCIDLPERDGIDVLAGELLSADHEQQIALRGDARLVARFSHAPRMAAHTPPPVRSDATYVVTGGAGGLGRAVVAWLLARGAGRVVILARTPPADDLGERVGFFPCDVSDREQVMTTFARIAAKLPPVRGVVHTAGVLADAMLRTMGPEELLAPLRPKVLGAFNLHLATRALPLDFFVLYSSLAAHLGSPGQTSYSAGNGFLDGLAHARVALGLRATSIGWGPFRDVGLAAARDDRGARLAAQGIANFAADESIPLLEASLARSSAHVAFARIDFRQWLEANPKAAAIRWFAEVGRLDARSLPPAPQREDLTAIPLAERTERVSAILVELIAKVLRLDPRRIERRAPLSSMGVDSLMSLELRNRLEATIGVRLSAALLYTYPTVVALSGHLARQLEPPAPPVSRAAPSGPLSPTSALDVRNEELGDLSAEDLLAALDAELSLAKKES